MTGERALRRVAARQGQRIGVRDGPARLAGIVHPRPGPRSSTARGCRAAALGGTASPVLWRSRPHGERHGPVAVVVESGAPNGGLAAHTVASAGCRKVRPIREPTGRGSVVCRCPGLVGSEARSITEPIDRPNHKSLRSPCQVPPKCCVASWHHSCTDRAQLTGTGDAQSPIPPLWGFLASRVDITLIIGSNHCQED